MTVKEMIIRGLTSFNITSAPEAVDDLVYYVGELMRWNDRINLVGLKGVRAVVTELLYDAFFLHGYVKRRGRILDLGSGSGVLAIPLKILDPEMESYSIDSSLRKIQFQRHIKRGLSLEGFVPVHDRIEHVEPLGADCLVAKAFGTIPQILEKGCPHMKEGARAFMLKGNSEDSAEVPGFNLEKFIPYSLPGTEKRYRLFIYRKSH